MTGAVNASTAVAIPADAQSGLLAVTQEIAAWVAGLPALPPDDGNRYNPRRLTVAWVLEARGNSVHTAKAYRRDLSTYLGWCERERLNPLTARPTDLGQYRVWRELQGPSGGIAKPATVARALAATSSWYEHLVVNTDGEIGRNPAAGVKRPPVPKNSTTAGLTDDELDRLLDQADLEAATRHASWKSTPTPGRHARYLAAMRDRALLRLLADLGLRIAEALDRNLSDLSYQRGHRTLKYIAKGGDERERPLVPDVLEALDEYLDARATAADSTVGALRGPLFATDSGGRLVEPHVFVAIRRLAAAASITSAGRLSPHSLRHAFATSSRAAGVALEDVSDAMNHADPRTTRRYDRDRYSLERDPAHVLSAQRALRRRTRTAGAPEDG